MTIPLRAHALHQERAKYLAPQSSPALQRAREQTAIVLSLALCEKEAAIAAGFGVSPRAVYNGEPKKTTSGDPYEDVLSQLLGGKRR